MAEAVDVRRVHREFLQHVASSCRPGLRRPGAHLVDGESADLDGAVLAEHGDRALEVPRTGCRRRLDHAERAVPELAAVTTAVSSVSMSTSARGAAREDAVHVAHHPLQQVDVVARLVRQDTAVERPGAAPGILVVVVLRDDTSARARCRARAFRSAPPPAPRAASRTGTLKRFCFTTKSLMPCVVAAADHRVRVVQRQRHRLLDHDVLAVLARARARAARGSRSR